MAEVVDFNPPPEGEREPADPPRQPHPAHCHCKGTYWITVVRTDAYGEREDRERCPGLGKARVVPSGAEQQKQQKVICRLCDGTGFYEVLDAEGHITGCVKCPHPPAHAQVA